jgi:hypothetical protein
MNPGIIFCGWGTLDLVQQSLAPWIELRRQGKAVICAVSVRFAGFEGEDDGTREYLREVRDRGDIDYLIDSPDSVPETTARGMALQYLRAQDVDAVIQFDSDEITDIQSIERMLVFTEVNSFAQWFRFSYANLVFDTKTHLAEPFTPPRFHRMKAGDGYFAHSFSGDNDICYGHHILRNLLPQDHFASQTIPWSVFKPLHYSWLSDTPERAARSRAKIRYQLEGRKWPSCQFSWDDAQGGLIFNPALPKPKVIHE